MSVDHDQEVADRKIEESLDNIRALIRRVEEAPSFSEMLRTALNEAGHSFPPGTTLIEMLGTVGPAESNALPPPVEVAVEIHRAHESVPERFVHPFWAVYLLGWLRRPIARDAILDNLEEQFRRDAQRYPDWQRRKLYWQGLAWEIITPVLSRTVAGIDWSVGILERIARALRYIFPG